MPVQSLERRRGRVPAPPHAELNRVLTEERGLVRPFRHIAASVLKIVGHRHPVMRNRRILSACLTLATVPVLVSAQNRTAARAPVAARVTAFVDVSVVPMDSERIVEHQTVVVRGKDIVAMGPVAQVEVPATAVRVDGMGKYLMPGLADMHAHLPGFRRLVELSFGGEGDLTSYIFADDDRIETERMLFMYAANGVTTLRVMHGSADLLDLRDQITRGTLLGPRMYVATPQALSDEGDVDLPAKAQRMGYDLIKMNELNDEDVDAMAEAAHRIGMPIAGHAPGNPKGSDSGAGVDRATKDRYASIEHLNGFVNIYGGGEAFVDSATLKRQAKGMHEANVYSCPTIVTLLYNAGYFNYDTIMARPEFRFVTDSTRERWTARVDFPPMGPVDTAILRSVAVRRGVLKTLSDAGVRLLIGTDATVGMQMPGFAVHHEMEEFVKAGLTPYQALEAGTRNVATYFGTQDSVGTVAVGKRADLVLLTANPLQDIRHTTQRDGVMVAGWWLPQAELDKKLADLEGTVF